MRIPRDVEPLAVRLGSQKLLAFDRSVGDHLQKLPVHDVVLMRRHIEIATRMCRSSPRACSRVAALHLVEN